MVLSSDHPMSFLVECQIFISWKANVFYTLNLCQLFCYIWSRPLRMLYISSANIFISPIEQQALTIYHHYYAFGFSQKLLLLNCHPELQICSLSKYMYVFLSFFTVWFLEWDNLWTNYGVVSMSNWSLTCIARAFLHWNLLLAEILVELF